MFIHGILRKPCPTATSSIEATMNTETCQYSPWLRGDPVRLPIWPQSTRMMRMVDAKTALQVTRIETPLCPNEHLCCNTVPLGDDVAQSTKAV